MGIQELVSMFQPKHVRQVIADGNWQAGECPVETGLWIYLLRQGLPVAAMTGRDGDYYNVTLHFCYADPVEVSLPAWAAVASKMLATASIVGPVTARTVNTVLEIVDPS